MEEYVDELGLFLEADASNPIERHLRAAILALDTEKIKELLPLNRYPMISVLYVALQVGNLNIIKLLFDSGYVYLTPVDDEIVLNMIEELDQNSLEKVEIVKFVLPFYFSNFPIRLTTEYLDLIESLLDDDTHNLFQFLMENFYSEQKNGLFPLMKKLEASVDDPEVLLILMHDKIVTYDGIDDFFQRNRLEFVRIFKELLIKETPETIQLTNEIFRVLLDKEIDFVLDALVLRRQVGDPILQETEFEMISPVLLKRLFQVIYVLYNSLRKSAIINSIFSWFELCCWKYRKYYQLCQSMIPFIIKPANRLEILKIIYKCHGFTELERMLDSDSCDVVSLKGICRNVIISKTAQVHRFDPKKVLNGLLTLNLHEDLKFYLLRIPDPSWIIDFNL